MVATHKSDTNVANYTRMTRIRRRYSCHSHRPKGFILVTSILIMVLLLLLGIYATSFTITELKISSSQARAVQTYYLAESGIAEAIWLIKNDATWQDEFENNPSCSLSQNRASFLGINGGSYIVTIACTGQARGTITATGQIDIGNGQVAQRVSKSTISKAIGGSVLGNNGEVSDGNINLTGTTLNLYNGSMMANGNIIVDFWSIINSDDDVKATGNVNINWTSSINASSIEASNYPPAPDPIAMPSISFDDPDDPESLKAQATAIYDEDAFEDLLWANPDLTLDGITYVEGDIEIENDHNLTINGALVADGNIEVGKNAWCCIDPWNPCDRSNVTINQQASGTPTGLISKERIDFELCLNNFIADGLIYG